MSAPIFRGTKDYFGAEAKIRRFVIETYRQVLESYGFEQLETPMMERDEVLRGKQGTQKIIDLAMEHFAGLRFDHTVPLAAFMVRNAEKVIKPYRRYAFGPVFRDETAAAGRLRQFWQLDFDTVGSDSLLVDAEIPAINYEVLTKLGFEGLFVININDKRLLNAMVMSMGFMDQSKQQAVFRAWDKLGRIDLPDICAELKEKQLSDDEISVFTETTNFLTSLKGKSSNRILDEIQLYFLDDRVNTAAQELEKLLSLVRALNVPEDAFVVNPLMARGLDYYTGPIFETIVEKAGVGSITGGGRFDKLIANLGGPDLPASGSSFGLERIIAVMEELGIVPEVATNSADIFITIFNADSLELTQASFEVASNLRLTGLRVEVYNGDTSKLGKQIDIARRKDIPIVLVIGPDELSTGSVMLKDMATGNQLSVKRSDLADAIEWRLKT